MTENQLRTTTCIIGYGLVSLFMAALALQNLRYGFYGLFYAGMGITLIGLTGTVYTFVSRANQLVARFHLPILTTMTLFTGLTQFSAAQPETSHWLFPIIILNFLALPLWQALILCGALLAALIMRSLLLFPLAEALMTIAAALGLITLAAYLNGRHTLMVRSAETLAITDSLTGAHNVRFLDETLHKEISRCQATGHPLSVVRLQVDHLSEIENLHGTAAMQKLRRGIAEALFSTIRAGDTLYALDDGDFFLVLPFTPEEGVRVIGERVRQTIRERSWPPIGRVTVSLGCTTRSAADQTPDQLSERARQALERATREGTDRAWFQPQPEAAS